MVSRRCGGDDARRAGAHPGPRTDQLHGAVAVNTRSGAQILLLWPSFRLIDFMAILEAVDGASLDRLERFIVYGENDDTPALFHDNKVLAYGRWANDHPITATRAAARSAATSSRARRLRDDGARQRRQGAARDGAGAARDLGRGRGRWGSGNGRGQGWPGGSPLLH